MLTTLVSDHPSIPNPKDLCFGVKTLRISIQIHTILAGRVFKQIRNKEIGEVTGNLVGLEREWAIGRQLNLLDDPDGYLPGFMQTGSKVLDHEGQFLGMTLEKLNGGDVLDRFEDPLFNDVDYILSMIVQVRCLLVSVPLSLLCAR